MSVKLNNKFYTLIIYIYLHIYQERCFDKNNQAVLIYQLIHNLVTRKICLTSSNIESCYNCYLSYQF